MSGQQFCCYKEAAELPIAPIFCERSDLNGARVGIILTQCCCGLRSALVSLVFRMRAGEFTAPDGGL